MRRGLIDAGRGRPRRRAREAADARRSATSCSSPYPAASPGQRRIKSGEWPDPTFVDVGVRGDLQRIRRRPHVVATEADTSTVRGRRSSSRPSPPSWAAGWRPTRASSCMGEDVHRLNGGTNGATRGSTERFPDRVLGTPISENAFAGLGGGIALDGRFRPVVEFMYADFMWVAADQLFNQIAQGPAHVRRRRRRAARAAEQGRDGHRLRVPALDGPGRHLRHLRRLADRRPDHALRLRRADELAPCAARTRSSCSSTSTSTTPPVPARSTTSTTACPSARPRCAARARTSRS